MGCHYREEDIRQQERRYAEEDEESLVLSRRSITVSPLSIFPLSFEISLNFLLHGFKGIGVVMQTAHRRSLGIVCRLLYVECRLCLLSAGNFFANYLPLSLCFGRRKTTHRSLLIVLVSLIREHERVRILLNNLFVQLNDLFPFFFY